MIATTIEQSKHLLELGLDPKTADMWWSNRFVYWQPTPMIGISAEQHQLYTFKWCDEDVPAWSLSALLDVMRQANAVTTLQVTSLSTLMRCKDMASSGRMICISMTTTAAAYEMVCWLLKNNLIKKGDNDEQ